MGATITAGGTFFRVWAPRHDALRVAVEQDRGHHEVPMVAEANGYFSVVDPAARAGDRYWFEAGKRRWPDPASRFQPHGVEGSSEVVDPFRFPWRARDWRRPSLCGRVIYELHVGTFTPAGSFRGVIDHLDHLVTLGVNTIELMPLGDFMGRWNWGYDGVMPFAPARCYGRPDDLRALIDAAHARRLAVVIDVVYNHLGPCGNVLPAFSDHYFRAEESGWGAGLNFDGEQSAAVREYFLQNVAMWLDEYRVDGLRIDATHALRDSSEPPILAEIAAAAHTRGAFVIAEDERNEARIVTDEAAGGWGCDGVWADDFHHVLRVAATGRRAGYYQNYAGTIAELARTLRDGWLFQGQHFASWGRPRGSPVAHVPASSLVLCISNHDQVGNRPRGDRLSDVVAPEVYRAMSMLLCLAPYTPMLFQGQEWAASSPFPFFTDHPGEVGANMAAARRREFARQGEMFSEEELRQMTDPQAASTFERAKLSWGDLGQPSHRSTLELYRCCLALRAAHPVFQSCDRRYWHVSALGTAGVKLHWQHPDGEWALVFSLLEATDFVPPDGAAWQRVLASNEERFGGRPGNMLTGPGAVLWRLDASAR